jgi:hypothetical protein
MTSGYPEKHMEFCSKIQLKVSITAPVYEWINMIDLGLLSIPDGTIQVEPAPDALFNQIGYVISQDNFQKQPEMERFCETHSNIRYIVECMNSISQIHAPHESQLAALRHMCPMSFLETKNLSFTYKDMIYMFQKMSRRSPIWEPDFRLWVQKDVPYSDEFIMSYKF